MGASGCGASGGIAVSGSAGSACGVGSGAAARLSGRLGGPSTMRRPITVLHPATSGAIPGSRSRSPVAALLPGPQPAVQGRCRVRRAPLRRAAAETAPPAACAVAVAPPASRHHRRLAGAGRFAVRRSRRDHHRRRLPGRHRPDPSTAVRAASTSRRSRRRVRRRGPFARRLGGRPIEHRHAAAELGPQSLDAGRHLVQRQEPQQRPGRERGQHHQRDPDQGARRPGDHAVADRCPAE